MAYRLGSTRLDGSVVVWTVAPGNFQAVGRVCEMLVVGLLTYLC